MTPRLWFSVALRVLGVWELLDALYHFTTVITIKTGLYTPVASQPASFFVHGVVKVLIAIVLLKWASLVAAYFYPLGPEKAQSGIAQ
jgi:hypothetical protein